MGDNRVKNRGIGGDIISWVNDRIEEVTASQPAQLFLMVGVNDVRRQRSREKILGDYDTLLMSIQEQSPRTQVYVHSLLPVRDRKLVDNQKIIEVNLGIQELCVKYEYTYVNLHPHFIDSSGRLDTRYTFDGLHLNGEGYLLWKEIISPYILH